MTMFEFCVIAMWVATLITFRVSFIELTGWIQSCNRSLYNWVTLQFQIENKKKDGPEQRSVDP